jgi:hypothetical protein
VEPTALVRQHLARHRTDTELAGAQAAKVRARRRRDVSTQLHVNAQTTHPHSHGGLTAATATSPVLGRRYID